MFEQIKIAEQVYERETTSKAIKMSDANRDSRVSKRKGRESALPTNPKKGRTDNLKTKNVVSPSENTTNATNKCLMDDPRHSSEDYKITQ